MNIQKISIAVCIIAHSIDLQSSQTSHQIVIDQHFSHTANNSFADQQHSVAPHSFALSNGSVGPHSLPPSHDISSRQSVNSSTIQGSNTKFVNHSIIDSIKNTKRILSLFKQKYDPNAYTQTHDEYENYLRRMYIKSILEAIQEHTIPCDPQQPTTKIQRRHMRRLTTKQNAIIAQLAQLLKSLQTKKPTSTL